MKSCIQKAIESLCDDIRGGMDATANYQRAEAVMMLAFSDMLISDENTNKPKSEDEDDASIQEFAEKLKEHSCNLTEYDEGGWSDTVSAIKVKDIDRLLEEMGCNDG